MRSFKNKKGSAPGFASGLTPVSGFTLVEILMVVFLVGILATTAITSYVNTTDTFTYLSNYKSVMSAIQTARSYALTNKFSNTAASNNTTAQDRYGVHLTANSAVAFADNGTIPFEFDVSDTKMKEYNFSDISIYIQNSQPSPMEISLPVDIFYESVSGEVAILKTTTTGVREIVPKNQDKFITIKISEIGGDLIKYIVLFQVSGLPEEYNDLSGL